MDHYMASWSSLPYLGECVEATGEVGVCGEGKRGSSR